MSGVVNAQTESVGGYIRTDADSIHLTNTNFAFRNSGYNYFSGDLDILSMYRNTLPFIGGNGGYGLDLGVNYQVTDKLGLSASVTDLGYIDWKENTESYTFNEINYSFKGFDIIDLLGNEGNNEDFFQNEVDSLENLLTPTELENIVYRSSLVSNFYTGIDYAVHKNHHLGAQVYGRMAEGNLVTEFGAYYNLRIGNVVNAVVNASFRNGKIHAAGAGMSLDMGPIQIYGTTESVTSLLNPQAANLLDARVGMNLKFGRKKKPREEDLVEQEEEDLYQEEPEELVAEEIVPEEEVIEPAAVAAAAAVVAAPAVLAENEEPEIEMPVKEEIIPVVEEVAPVVEAAPVVVVKQGNHQDELGTGHYIVVGAFLERANALNYSRKLKASGYDNQFGFLTEKDYYYVTVYKNGDINKARQVRNEFRKKDEFLFPDTWLLSVVE